MLWTWENQKGKKNFFGDVLFFRLYQNSWAVQNPPPENPSKVWDFGENNCRIGAKGRGEKFEEAIWHESTCWEKWKLRDLPFKIDWSED